MKKTDNSAMKFISPAKVLADAGVAAGDTVIDYGCGAGHWVLVAAGLVGQKGRVIALENDEGLLGLIRGRAELAGISNIETILLDLENGKLPEEKGEIVIVANVMYTARDKVAFAKRAAELLKPKGRLIFVDWGFESIMFGPKKSLRLKEEDVITAFEKVGLHLVCSVDTGHHHYGLIFDKNGESDE